MARLVLYHFSDLHFHRSDDFNRQIVLRALWEDIKRQMAAGLVPECIAVTGDIAWSGKAEEYKRAETEFFLPLMENTNLSRENIFMVPGNHDVDRDVLSDVNPDKIASLCDRDSVNDASENSRPTFAVQRSAPRI
jgi:predicted MPP superfamily phosphohydrolase